MRCGTKRNLHAQRTADYIKYRVHLNYSYTCFHILQH